MSCVWGSPGIVGVTLQGLVAIVTWHCPSWDLWWLMLHV